MSKNSKKIGADKSYKRPKVTHTEKLTADEIAEKLQGYEKVDDIAEVPLNTHLRYFTKEKDGTQLFRSGGFLKNKTNAEKYVYLTNGKIDWVVQTATATFFSKMSQKEEIAAIHRQYQKKLEEKDRVINLLRKYIKDKRKQESLDSTSIKSAKKPSGSKTAKPKQAAAKSTTKPSGSKTAKPKQAAARRR